MDSLKGGHFKRWEVEKPVLIAGIVFTLSRRPAGVENEVRMSKFVPFLVWHFALHISGGHSNITLHNIFEFCLCSSYSSPCVECLIFFR